VVKPTTGPFYFNLTGRTPGTTYYYRAKAVGDGTAYGDEKSFTTGSPPAVSTYDASDLNSTSATLNGYLTSLGGADNVTASFVWGVAPDCDNETVPEVKTFAEAFHFDLDRLEPWTTYYYKAKALGIAGPVYGELKSFTTLSTPPAVTTNNATNLALHSATLNGSLGNLGTAANVSVSFEWGTLSAVYSNVTTAEVRAIAGTFYFDLTGLTPGTTYYYRAKAEGDGGAVYGDQNSFATSVMPPVVATGDATSVTPASAMLNANLLSLGTKSSVTVSFLWKVSGGTYNETTGEAKNTAGAVFADIIGLAQETTYYYRVKAVGDGEPVYGDEKSFATADGAVPVISLMGAFGITHASASITWTTDEPATSQVEYGLTEEYGSLTALDSNLLKSHTVDLAGLEAGKTYHYRVVSKDAADNQAVSADETFATASRSGGIPPWAWALLAVSVVAGLGSIFVLWRMDRNKRRNSAVP